MAGATPYKGDITLENWPADSLIGYARNPRKNDHAVDRMASAIKEFGFRIPVVAKRDGTIVDGHLRKKAADKLGLAEIPVVPADDLTEAQIKAFRLVANKSAEWAEWDFDLLATELGELNTEGFDLGLTGFGEEEIDRLLALNDATAQGNTDEDEAPEAQDGPAVTQTGDVWLLGKHRVRCGDSTSADDVAALLNGVEPHLMVTDPPYGVNYDPKARRSLQSVKSKPAQGQVGNDDKTDWRDAYSLFPGDVAYVWHAGNKAHIVAESLQDCGFELRAQIVWAKSKFVVGRGHYHPHHEPCWYAVKNNGHWQGSRKESTLWQIDHRKSETGHSTQKPVECMRRPIVNNSAPGQPVYDPFLGSGTTLIAGETEGRPVYGMELDPAYCDVIVKRWQEFTGKDATLEGDGRTFNEVAGERVPEAA